MLSRRQFNPAISPNDEDWKQVYSSFRKLVKKSDKTLGDIMLQYFTKYEVRMFVAQDRSDLKEIQKRNTERFKALFAERFNSLESGLITKMTMMYFGLPVEPIQEELDARTETELHVRDEEDSQRPPLKYLDKYDGAPDNSPTEMRRSNPILVRDEVEFDEPAIQVDAAQQHSMSLYAHTGHDSNLPMIEKSVMTVKEQAELLRAFRSVQSIALNRHFPCPFDGCHYQCRPGEEKLTRTHFERAHMNKKCPFCDEPQYWWWSREQQTRHMRSKHRNYLMDILGVRSASLVHDDGTTKFVIPLKKSPMRVVTAQEGLMPTTKIQYPLTKKDRESFLPQLRRPVQLQDRLESFCEFCGRNRTTFLNQFERDYHDRLCRPTTFCGARCTFCTICGEPRWDSKEDAIRSQLSTAGLCACSHEVNATGGGYCKDCGLDTCKLQEHPSQHIIACKGYSARNGIFCAYCGIKLLEDGEQDVLAPHLKEHRLKCYQRTISLRNEEMFGDIDDRIAEPPSPEPSDSSTKSGSVYTASEDDGEPEAERGRSRGRISKGKQPDVTMSESQSSLPKSGQKAGKSGKKRQRSQSPDWNEVLGEPQPGFVPGNNYYCSKCLRKVPKSTRRGRGEAKSTIEEEIKSHVDKGRCCRIRNGIGSAENLPNRSGWIPANKMSRIGKLKDKFLCSYPGYRNTVYPLQSSDYNLNMWRSDPNNPSNSAWWDIPWPPYAGELPFPNGWKAPEDGPGELGTETIEETARSKRRGKDKGKGPARKRTSDESDNATVERASGGDAAKETPESGAAMGGKRKRRKLSDATYKPPRRIERDSDDEMPADVQGATA